MKNHCGEPVGFSFRAALWFRRLVILFTRSFLRSITTRSNRMKFRLGCIHVCTFSRVHSSTLLYCEIRIQNSLKCAFLIEQRQLQFMRHFVLPGKKINAVFQAPIENFQIRSKPFVTYSFSCRFSNMAMNNQSTMNPPVPVTILKLRV